MSTFSTNETSASPCIGVCAMNDITGLCAGCFRTLDEIAQWWDMSNQDKHAILEQVAQRQMSLANFD